MNIAANIDKKAAEMIKQKSEATNKEAPKEETPKEETKQEQPKVETPKEEIPKGEQPKEEPKKETPKEEQPKKKVIKTVFGDREIDAEDESPAIETPEQFFESISKKTGKEIKSYEEIFGILDDPNKVAKEDLEKAMLEVDEYKLFLQGMPPDLKAIIAAYHHKQDYKAEMQNLTKGNIFTKPSKDIDKEELILLHNPEYSKEELDDLEDREKNALHKAARAVHDSEYNKIQDKAKAVENMQLDAAKKFTKSIDKTLQHLKKEMPNIDPKELQDVESTLKKGYSFIEDGQYKETAAVEIAMAKYGKNYINSVFEQAAKDNQRKIEQAKSNAVEQVIKEKTNDNIKTKSAAIPPKNAKEEIKKQSFPWLK